jgi:hypothetical protein
MGSFSWPLTLVPVSDSSIVLEVTADDRLPVVSDDREAHAAKAHHQALYAQPIGTVLQKQ